MSFGRLLDGFAKGVAERFPRAAAMYRSLRETAVLSAAPKMTPAGFFLAGNRIMEEGAFEPEETALIRSLLPHTDVFLNIGANIGYYSCLALQAGKQTVAFEPMVQNLRYLYKNIAANRWEDRIEIFPLALSNRSGIISIYGGGTGASLIKGWASTPEQFVTFVPVSTLDTVVGARFDGRRCLVLVDIEGAELFMLKGASRFLSGSPKPLWMMEITVTEHQPSGIGVNPNLLATFELFWANGYEARTADKLRRPVTREEVQAVAASGRNTLNTYNFLFIEEGRHPDLFPP